MSVCPAWLQDLRVLTCSLPSTVPVAVEHEANPLLSLAHYNIEVAMLEDDASDPWETINRALDNHIGYGRTVEDLATFVRRGDLGMARLCCWLEQCVSVFKIDPVLLEPRLAKLCAALKA